MRRQLSHLLDVHVSAGRIHTTIRNAVSKFTVIRGTEMFWIARFKGNARAIILFARRPCLSRWSGGRRIHTTIRNAVRKYTVIRGTDMVWIARFKGNARAIILFARRQCLNRWSGGVEFTPRFETQHASVLKGPISIVQGRCLSAFVDEF